jgi:hypothetical protein
MESTALGFDDMTLVDLGMAEPSETTGSAGFVLPPLLEMGEGDPGEFRPPSNGTSGSSPVFSTPVSRSASQAERDVGEENGSKVGLLLVVSPRLFCGGLIKSDGPKKWCTRGRELCSVKAHAQQKVNLEPATYYIMCPRAGQARLAPCLDATCGSIPREDSDLEGKLATMSTWVAYIQSVVGHDEEVTSELARREIRVVTGLESRSEGGDSWEHILSPPRLNEFSREVLMMKTPRRIELRQAPIGDTTPIPMDRDQDMMDLGTLDPNPDDEPNPSAGTMGRWAETIARDWGSIKNNFLILTGVLEEEKAATHFNFKKLMEELASMGCKLSLLDTRIGKNLLEEEGVVSVWEGIEGVISEGQLFRETLLGLEGQHSEFEKQQSNMARGLVELRNGWISDKAGVETLKTTLGNLVTSYRTNMGNVIARLNVLSAGTAGIGMPNNASSQGVARTEWDALNRRVNEFNNRWESEARSLRNEVDTMKSVQDRNLNQGGSRWGQPERNVIDLVDQTNGHAIEELKGRVTHMESNRGAMAYKSIDFNFSSEFDLRLWLIENKVATCGSYWDLFSILVKLGDRPLSGHQQAQVTHAASKIQTTPLELDLMSSMRVIRPSILFQDDLLEMDVLKCRSHKSWMGANSMPPFQLNMAGELSRVIAGIRGTLRHQEGNTTLAHTLLGTIEVQYQKLVRFIESFYQELTSVANFPEESAWKLIGRCLGGFFQAMVPIRAGVTMLDEYKTVDQKAHMIWTVLQCHTIVEQFIDVGFKGHTTMVHQMTLYMMTERVDPSQLASLQTTVKEANQAVVEAVRNTKSFNETIDKLKRQVDNLKHELEQVKKRPRAT